MAPGRMVRRCVSRPASVGRWTCRLLQRDGGGGAGGRPLTAEQQRIVELWVDRGLAMPGFTGGNVITFLNQLFRLIR